MRGGNMIGGQLGKGDGNDVCQSWKNKRGEQDV